MYMGLEDEQGGKREAVTKKIVGLNVDIWLALPAPLIVVWSESSSCLSLVFVAITTYLCLGDL